MTLLPQRLFHFSAKIKKLDFNKYVSIKYKHFFLLFLCLAVSQVYPQDIAETAQQLEQEPQELISDVNISELDSTTITGNEDSTQITSVNNQNSTGSPQTGSLPTESPSVESPQSETISTSESNIEKEETLIEPRDYDTLSSEEALKTDIDGTSKNAQVNQITRKELDIIVPDNQLVEKHRKSILSDFGREWLYKIMNQGSLYSSYIMEEMRDNDMPECIAYLPVIESSYVTTAVSKSGAVGLWQFMENSIAPFLIKNHWVDERLDPWLSTEAAIRKLKDNYSVLGDWYLALAAYNCGLGAVRKAVAKSEEKDFWYMAEHNLLPSQTIQYVPRFLAVADIITNAEYYEVELPEPNTAGHIAFTKLEINKAIDIPILSDKTGIDTDVFDYLNPALKYNMTPPIEKYFIRVPSDSVEKIAKAIEELDETMYSGIYTVRQGDTLWGISRKYGITVNDLCLINKINEKAILRIGTVLNVPILK